MEEEIAFTQDCIEWNEEDPFQLVSNTPASREKQKNPHQEVEDLWNLFDKAPSSPLKSNNKLQRAHSYPRRQKRRERIAVTTAAIGDRKRKRPSSANNNARPTTVRPENSKAALTSAGFQDLLKQLDAAPSVLVETAKPNAAHPSNGSTTPHSSLRNDENMPPPLLKKQSPVHPPAKKRKFLTVVPGPPATSAYRRVTPNNCTRSSQLPPPNRQAPSVQTTTSSYKISTPIPSKGTSLIAPKEVKKVSEFDDDDDFDLSAAELAALDAVMSTSKLPPTQPSVAKLSQHVSQSSVAKLSQHVVTHAVVATKVPPARTKNIVVPPPSSIVNPIIAAPRVSCAPPPTKPVAAVCQPDDEFGDLDFGSVDLDALIETKRNSSQGTAAVKPPRESFGDPFGDDFDFSELDAKIAARVPPKGILKSNDSDHQVDMTSLQLPPGDFKVANKLVADFDPQRMFVAFSRYKIVAVKEDSGSYTKAVLVKAWTTEMSHDARRRSNSRKKSANKENETTGDGWMFLRGEWYHTPVAPNDALHLCSISGRYQTNLDALPMILHTAPPHGSDPEDDLILVLHPDTLVAPTIVSETVSCSRRAVLRSRLGSTGISNKAALFGTMKHSLFEKCMSHQNFSINFAKETTLAIVRQTAESLVALGIKEAESEMEVLRVLPQLQRFQRDYMATDGRAIGQAKTVEGNGAKPNMKLAGRSVQGCEESLVSAEFGLKGNIDVTLKATTQDVASQFVANPSGPETSIVGIELKTGHNQNPQNAHMAQLALYTLMLSGRYGGSSSADQHACKSGILLYLNDKGTRSVRVTPFIQELKSLIGQRNVVATELKAVSSPRGIEIAHEEGPENELSVTIKPAPPALLPAVTTSPPLCSRCYSNRECMTYAAAESSTALSNGSHSKLLSHFAGHLDQVDLQYFRDWDRLIDLEADATSTAIASLWLTPSLELEKSNGRTASSLIVDDGFVAPSQNENGLDYVPISFHRSSDAVSDTELSALSFDPGCLVVISTDGTTLSTTSEEKRKHKVISRNRNAMHIARGVVHSVTDSKIVVKISPQECRQVNREREVAMIQRRTLKFRLDRDDVQTGLGTMRQNLVNLFTGDVKPFQNSQADPKLSQNQIFRNRYAKLRESIVRLRQPKFDPMKCTALFKNASRVSIPGCDLKKLEQEFSCLNRDQQDSVRKVFSASDYSLIQGLPGTGKSSTIAFVARLLVAHGKRVIITSYTHAAVDNLIMKLIEKGVSSTAKSNPNPKIVRIGRKTASHPAVHPILLTEVASSFQQVIDTRRKESDERRLSEPSADVLKLVLSNARIVGVTALSIPRSPVLVGQDFDVVIVDEAGQISQPAILGALMAADSFVLVGDHKQLPPLVSSDTAEKAGFGVSMLSRLAEEHSGCVAQLTLQYRMHNTICELCNDIVYGGTLKCANQDVSSKLLKLDGFHKARLDRWLSRLIDPKNPVMFGNTDYFEHDVNQSDPKQLVSLERQPEKGGKGNLVNDNEVTIVKRVIQGLLDSGLPASSICIISPFRAQVRQLNDSAAISLWKTAGLEISTIDRYQGRDKEAIILTFVRSNKNGYSGRLLNDYRRLNVAVSRAMQKLIMVGSFSTLAKGSAVLRPILEKLETRKQVVPIPQHILRSQIVSRS